MYTRPLSNVMMLVLGVAASGACADDHAMPADAVLRREVTRARTPGLQYVHVSAESVLYRFTDGLADVATRSAVTPTTTFNGFSVTKTFTAVAVLQLAERGLVRLDDPVATYLPDFPYPAGITVRNLLTHSAGIPNPIPLRWVHLAEAHDGFDRDAFFHAEYARHAEVASTPNARFAYSNLGYELLGEVIERTSGVSFERYVSENILAPLGIPDAELGFSIDRTRHAMGYHRVWSLSYPVLGFLLDRDALMGSRTAGWRAFRPYYMNGAAYGGLVGTADGFARYLQALLDPSSGLLSDTSRQVLFAENVLADGTPSGMTTSWFTGSLDGEPFFDHAGGGGGYYAEIRLYPGLGRASVLLMNRTGLKNSRVLDAVDRDLVRDAKRAVARATGRGR